jgi:hypothetical protein
LIGSPAATTGLRCRAVGAAAQHAAASIGDGAAIVARGARRDGRAATTALIGSPATTTGLRSRAGSAIDGTAASIGNGPAVVTGRAARGRRTAHDQSGRRSPRGRSRTAAHRDLAQCLRAVRVDRNDEDVPIRAGARGERASRHVDRRALRAVRSTRGVGAQVPADGSYTSQCRIRNGSTSCDARSGWVDAEAYRPKGDVLFRREGR